MRKGKRSHSNDNLSGREEAEEIRDHEEDQLITDDLSTRTDIMTSLVEDTFRAEVGVEAEDQMALLEDHTDDLPSEKYQTLTDLPPQLRLQFDVKTLSICESVWKKQKNWRKKRNESH